MSKKNMINKANKEDIDSITSKVHKDQKDFYYFASSLKSQAKRIILEERKALLEQYKELETKHEETCERLESLKIELNSNNNDNLIAKIDELNIYIEEQEIKYKKTLDEKKEKIRKMNDDISNMTKETDDLKFKLKTNKTQFESKIKKWKTKYEKSQKEIEKLSKKYKDEEKSVKDQIEKLKDENRELKKIIKENKESPVVFSENKKEKEIVKNLETRIKEYEENKIGMGRKLEKKDTTISKLENKINGLENMNNSTQKRTNRELQKKIDNINERNQNCFNQWVNEYREKIKEKEEYYVKQSVTNTKASKTESNQKNGANKKGISNVMEDENKAILELFIDEIWKLISFAISNILQADTTNATKLIEIANKTLEILGEKHNLVISKPKLGALFNEKEQDCKNYKKIGRRKNFRISKVVRPAYYYKGHSGKTFLLRKAIVEIKNEE